jgi:hypothetical protein
MASDINILRYLDKDVEVSEELEGGKRGKEKQF